VGDLVVVTAGVNKCVWRHSGRRIILTEYFETANVFINGLFAGAGNPAGGGAGVVWGDSVSGTSPVQL